MSDKEENKSEECKESAWLRFVRGNGVMNLPNKLTISRVVMIPVFVLFFYLQFAGHYFVALAVFAIASLTDLADGKIARKYNLVTTLGKFLDPIADKVLVLAATIVLLTKPEFFTANLGDWALICAGCCVALIVGREMIVSGFRMVAADKGVVIAADIIGKYKTTTQDLSIVLLLIGAGFGEFFAGDMSVVVLNCAGLALFAISAVLTVISGINYIVKNIGVLKS